MVKLLRLAADELQDEQRHRPISRAKKLMLEVLVLPMCLCVAVFVSEYHFIALTLQQKNTDTYANDVPRCSVSSSSSLSSSSSTIIHQGNQTKDNNNNNNNSNPLDLDFFNELYVAQSDREVLEQNFSFFFDARDDQGNLGYIADPTALRRGVRKFLNTRHLNSRSSRFFDVLVHYESRYHLGTNTGMTSLNATSICSLKGGEGAEGPNGFKLLSQKIEVVPKPNNNDNSNSPRILCMVYTHGAKRHLARTAALTWGIKCDGFLAFSTETIPSLGMLDLVHPGKEEYENMWQKVRSIWGYVGQHYLQDYDYFHIVGNDVAMIVENYRHFITHRLEQQYDRNTKPILTGAHAKIWPEVDGMDYILGGPGYTMNRAALEQFIHIGLDPSSGCFRNQSGSHEDQLIGRCFREKMNIGITDSHDPETGQQLFHHWSAERVVSETNSTVGETYFNRARRAWSQLPLGGHSKNNRTIGVQEGLDAAHKHSIVFHRIQTPVELARYSSILYRLCPKNSPLESSIVMQSSSE